MASMSHSQTPEREAAVYYQVVDPVGFKTLVLYLHELQSDIWIGRL